MSPEPEPPTLNVAGLRLPLRETELETLSTFFGGMGFGWLAWRTRSVLYGALLHVYLISLILLVTST